MVKLTRRSLLKYSALSTGVLVLTSCGYKETTEEEDLDKEAATLVQANVDVDEEIYRSACNPECNHCAFSVHVRNGRWLGYLQIQTLRASLV